MILMIPFTVTAYGLIEQVLPFLLKFLADEYDDTSTAVFAFVNDILTIVCIYICAIYCDSDPNFTLLYSSRSKSVLCNHTPSRSRNFWAPY